MNFEARLNELLTEFDNRVYACGVKSANRDTYPETMEELQILTQHAKQNLIDFILNR